MTRQALKMNANSNVQRTYSSRSLHGRVVHELGRRIVSGQLRENEILPNEAELGTEFEVSRTALREGIKVLTAKGLLVSRTRTGTRVRPRLEWNMLDPDIMAWRMESSKGGNFQQDLIEFRRATEPMAASLAAVRATDAQLAGMTKELERMAAAAPDVLAMVDPDMRFHRAILEASGNELLASLSSAMETTLATSVPACEPEKMFDAVRAHRVVLDAICARDSVAASEAMFALLDGALEWNQQNS